MTDTELRRLAESNIGIADVPLAPDVVIGLLDRIKALEVGMNEIAAVHAELRALFQERPIVNMIDEVRKALDRPEISVADASVAVGYLDECGQLSGDDLAAYRRVEEALRAHAAKGGE